MKKLPHLHRCDACTTRYKSIFNQIPLTEVNQVDEGKVCYSFKRGEVIFYEGQMPQGVYCLEKGKVKIFNTGPEGRDQIVRLAGAGDVVGYRALLSGDRYESSAACLDDTEVCFIPKRQLLSMVTGQSCLAMRFMQHACQELGHASKLITNLAQKTVRERMAEVVLVVQETFGDNELGQIDVRLSREEWASLVGTATESCIRVLSDFQQEGLIELQGKFIKVLDRKGLVKLGKVVEA
jgi:CRP/FNR family transcriptional regulator, polysaccharide utilization system transcription regulator